MLLIMLSEKERFELYIALRRLRTELWRSFPPMVFVRWLFNKHPRWVIPFASLLAAGMIALMLTAGPVTR